MAGRRPEVAWRAAEWLTLLGLLTLVVGPLTFGLLQLEYPWTWWGEWITVDGERRYAPGALDYVVALDVDETGAARRIPGPLLRGVAITLGVSLAALLIALPAGVALGLGSVSPNRGLRAWCGLYVETVRNSPLLIQIFVFYYVVGATIDSLPRLPGSIWSDHRAALLGTAALAVFCAAYLAEIVRGGIEALPPGQLEAARALGLSHGQAMRAVILPQALRAGLPAMAGQFVSLVKDSSLLSVIGVLELTKRARESIGTSLLALELWLLAAALYLVITIPLAQGVRWLERRLARSDR